MLQIAPTTTRLPGANIIHASFQIPNATVPLYGAILSPPPDSAAPSLKDAYNTWYFQLLGDPTMHDRIREACARILRKMSLLHNNLGPKRPLKGAQPEELFLPLAQRWRLIVDVVLHHKKVCERVVFADESTLEAFISQPVEFVESLYCTGGDGSEEEKKKEGRGASSMVRRSVVVGEGYKGLLTAIDVRRLCISDEKQ
ncbi:Hypothetical predicted protein [Lecanosticta acicola]|uniref:Uncharacterized protein n=1 Tax=Lecanosticta acicola TaxID=111012 RepID=A0AAI8YSL4_9PEZI|nr:Hypothetical predicted protein [Lecanosticta acicola]